MSKGALPLTDEEIDLLCRSFDGKYRLRNKALFLLGIATGFRVQELLSLKVGQVYDIKTKGFRRYIEVKKRNRKRKTESHRVLYNNMDSMLAVREWVEASGITDPTLPLFFSHKDMHNSIGIRPAWNILRQAFEHCGLTFRGTHCMRKTFARDVYEATERDLLLTKNLLGHKYLSSTQDYLPVTQAQCDEVLETINKRRKIS